MRHRFGGGRVLGVPATQAGIDAAASAASPGFGAGPAKAAADESGAAASVHTRVQHVRQNFKWDCGIACILMLMRTRGEHKAREDLIALVGTNSVWTVDLAYIMHKCGLPCVFHTVMEGVREEYAAETFYKDELDEDRARVEKLFRGAKAAGVAVKTEAVTIAQIAAAVLQGRLAIVLTDRRILRPKSDEKDAAGLRTRGDRGSHKTRATTGSKSRALAGATCSEASFTGHYVVRLPICSRRPLPYQ